MSRSLPKPVTYRAPRPHAWLWMTAVAIILVAAAIIFLLRQDLPDPDASQKIRLVGAAAAVLVGICVISATASRWIKH